MRILVIDDQVMQFMGVVDTWVINDTDLKDVKWECVTSGDEGIDILNKKEIDLVLIDGNLINEQGHQVVQKIRESGFNVYLCMFSSDIEQNELGLSAGAEFSINKRDFLEGCSKPLNKGQLEAVDNMAAIMILASLQ